MFNVGLGEAVILLVMVVIAAVVVGLLVSRRPPNSGVTPGLELPRPRPRHHVGSVGVATQLLCALEIRDGRREAAR